jgi:hypothetical protein
MKEIVKTQTVFVADDGKEFLDQLSCETYEKQVLGRLANIKYYIVHHNTEGRGFQATTAFAVEGYDTKEQVIFYCIEHFGNIFDWVMGVQRTISWTIPVEITRDTYLLKQKVFISDVELEGFPPPYKIK